MRKKVNMIKDLNINKVRSALKKLGIATKPQLAEHTGLSVVTVNSLVNTLIASGEILTHETLNSEGGRPAASFRYNSEYRLVLMIYMHEYRGQDTAFYCVVNLRGEVMEREKHLLSDVRVDSFDSHISEFIKKFTQIKAICFGIPGDEVNQRLMIIDYINLREQSLSGHISERFHLPVLVENDINAAVLGYCHRNDIPKDQCAVGIYFPDKYPPGAGIYVNGDVFKGRDGLAGEIKYLPFGIDWEAFDYAPKKVEEVMVKTVRAFSCMYNPDRIVLYGESVGPDIITKIRESCLSSVEQIMLPQIIISADLNIDFEAGIKQIAMRMIDKPQA